jgi:uncharacterized membrane protein YebE (DUF533 family)
MNSTLFSDRRAAGLLNRVREDVGQLRDDLGTLLSHTTKRTLPKGAKDLSQHAKQGLMAGGAFAASQLRGLRRGHHRQPAGWVGGAVVLSLLAYGAYSLFRNNNQTSEETNSTEPIDESTQGEMI